MLFPVASNLSRSRGWAILLVGPASTLKRNDPPKRQVRTELYIAGDQAKALFLLLQEQRQAFEQEFGYPLEWEELPTRRDCRISV
ncbi:DUF4268 domain-containing protein [Aquamicrobium zhengzhouense]|uniref:DUF4268 domain-containing protein n=1 Tax=Aquamicrobium zhengzhouense TaxID=2781738 RepID=UPI003898DF4B